MSKTIRIEGALPGPKSKALIERRAKAVAGGVSLAHPIFAHSAAGSTLTDVDGNVFIDFCGGIGCLNIGHARPEIAAVVASTSQRLTHACFQVTGYEEYVAVCEALVRLAPGGFDKKAVLLSTGAEAVENAVKIARKHTGRAAVLAFDHAFHGRTLLGMTLTGKAAPYKQGFGPFAPEVYRLPYPDPYRDLSVVGRLEQALMPHVRPEELAAVILEPVQGEGGFVVPPVAFFQELRAFCDKHKIVLIADEVQTGIGRTGTVFASEQLGFVPDLTTVAKSIAGGLPLSAVVGRAAIFDSVHVGGLGGTFAGNPVSCAAALATLAILEAEIAAGRPKALGEKLRARMNTWQKKHAVVGDVRGLGAMMAMELVRDPKTKTPADTETKALIAKARDKGVLLLSAGTFGNVVRFLMPLTIEDAVLNEGLDVVEAALAGIG
ncbi:MAG: 4-aminobutyrate--2-oxoglutarate transaminase [Deltaproteobacteria bacterium]|nr:4-aminobutyrate--2-oxoglutarate transaminase [Deltaproteobacteria bacterium]